MDRIPQCLFTRCIIIFLLLSSSKLCGQERSVSPVDTKSLDENVITNSVGMKLIHCPSGKFTMGENTNKVEVELTKGFYLGQYEVTQGEWKSVMGKEPWKNEMYVNVGDNYPATYVSWNDAMEFCKKLSKKESKLYRLPSEAEWEYACRAGSTTLYSFGDEGKKLDDYAWFNENTIKVEENFAHLVGKKKPNPLGFYDMHGNLFEFCGDFYVGDKLEGGRDPHGPSSGSFVVVRGGSWRNDVSRCSSAIRDVASPNSGSYWHGFRVVQDISK